VLLETTGAFDPYPGAAPFQGTAIGSTREEARCGALVSVGIVFQAYSNLYKAMGGGWIDEAAGRVGLAGGESSLSDMPRR